MLLFLVTKSTLTFCCPVDYSPQRLSMWFPRQEYCSGLPFPSPGDLPDPGMEPGSPACRQTLHHLSYQGSHAKRRNQTHEHIWRDRQTLDAKQRECWGLAFWKLLLHPEGATSVQPSWSLSWDMLPGSCFFQKIWEARYLCELSLKYSK